MLHELNEDDPDNRMQFCELMSERLTVIQNSINSISFSDECTVSLNGNFNPQNIRYWSDINPDILFIASY